MHQGKVKSRMYVKSLLIAALLLRRLQEKHSRLEIALNVIQIKDIVRFKLIHVAV